MAMTIKEWHAAGSALVVLLFVLWFVCDFSTLLTTEKHTIYQLVPGPNHDKLLNSSLICTECLSESELKSFEACKQRVVDQRDEFGPIRRGTCRFMKSEGRRPVALASAPGSGNTWLRGLLEKETGICTGIYCCSFVVVYSDFTPLRCS